MIVSPSAFRSFKPAIVKIKSAIENTRAKDVDKKSSTKYGPASSPNLERRMGRVMVCPAVARAHIMMRMIVYTRFMTAQSGEPAKQR